eukprot:g13872.t2
MQPGALELLQVDAKAISKAEEVLKKEQVKQDARAKLQAAKDSGNVDKLKAAMEEAQAAGLAEGELKHAKDRFCWRTQQNSLPWWTASLKTALQERNVHDLKFAIPQAKDAGIDSALIAEAEDLRCGNVSLEETPLEELARSLRTGGWTSHLKMEQATTEPSFPMYTLPAESCAEKPWTLEHPMSMRFPIQPPWRPAPKEKLLQMSQIQPHEELLAAGALTIYEERLGRAAFVSHQWVGKGHPDPEFKQTLRMRVLQDTLKNLLSGESEVSVDLITEAVYFRSTGLTAAEWQEKPLFLWYDYFSCPQLEEKGDACSNHLQMAIDSIPVYVSRCDFFMALCPVLSSPDGTETFSDYTWGDRGWCRVEQLVRDLTVNQGSWILVKSAMHQELKVSQLSSSSPGDAWSQAYAAILCRPLVLQSILQKKLIMCLAAGDLVQYRFLLNQQTAFLRNLPVEKVSARVCLKTFCARTDSERRWTGMLQDGGFRTSISGRKEHAWMLKVEMWIGAMGEVNMDKNTSVLAICAKFKNHEAMQVLLNAKAEVNTKAVHTPLGMSCLVNDPQGVRLLCDARADPHKKNPFGDHALKLGSQAIPVRLGWLISHCIGTSRDQFQKPTMMRRMAYHSRGATPLMLAIICGNFEAAATLLAERARTAISSEPLPRTDLLGRPNGLTRTDLRNFRGKTALDLAHELSPEDYLMDALNGVSCRKCWSIVSAANSKSLNPVIPSEGSIGARSMNYCPARSKALRQATERSRSVGHAPRRLTVNLDLAPQERWSFLAKEKGFESYHTLATGYLEKYIPGKILPLVDHITKHMDAWNSLTQAGRFAGESAYYHDYAEEMQSLASALNLSLGEVVLLNLVYQVEQIGTACYKVNTTGPCPSGPGLCSALVAESADAVWQGRNLDWDLDKSLLPFVVELLLGGKTPTHVIRKALETPNDYSAARRFLEDERLANPVYFILSGAQMGEGAIVTRDRQHSTTWALHEDNPKDSKHLNEQPGWFRFQTNYDSWKAVPRYDDRRGPGVRFSEGLQGSHGVNETSVMSNEGTAPRTIQEIFRVTAQGSDRFSYTVSGSMLELYCNNIVDLLSKANPSQSKAKLNIRQEKNGNVSVEGLVEEECSTADELMALLERGNEQRTVAATAMNSESSRTIESEPPSHLVLIIKIISVNKETKEVLKGKMLMCDLAGSERLKKSEVTEHQQTEAIAINKSLTALGDVIEALTKGGKGVVPYRNHKLTMLMQDSLGGTAKTLMFVNCSPASSNLDETFMSLKYAQRAKKITNTATKK